MRLLILVFIICYGVAPATGQKRITFSSQNYVGLLEGESGSALTLQTINGVKYKTWFTGIGTGLDYYQLRSIPVFLSANKDFSIKRNVLYLSVDGGTNIPWVKDLNTRWENPEFKRGPFIATGIGYKLKINDDKQALLFNAGYSFKRLRSEVNVTSPCLSPPCAVDIEKTRYDFNRISLRAGLEF